MSSDESDKTVFRQPSADPDRTVIKPLPGGRGAAAGGQQSVSSVPEPPLATPQAQQPIANSSALAGEIANFKTAYGLNPLVNAASTLITVFEKTRHALSHNDIGGLHQSLVNELKAFESNAKNLGIQPEIVLAARYSLCAALDEAVLNTPWGSESAWTQRTLLSVFHNETSGGEKFFAILDRMRQTPSANLDVLELMYVLLSLGFEGKYRVLNRGRDTLEQIRDELFRLIRSQRGEYERSLSPSWRGLGNTGKTLTQYFPMWVVASIVAAALFFGYSGFRYWLYQSSSPVAEQLYSISQAEEADVKNPVSNLKK